MPVVVMVAIERYGDAPIAVFHDATSHFAKPSGLNVAGSVALGDATDPGAKHLRELADRIEALDVACLFREPQHDPRLVERIAADTGRPAGTLDPLGATIAPGNRFYERLLSGLAEAVESCLSKVR